MNLSGSAERVESGRASDHNKKQDTKAAQGGINGSAEHVFSGGAAETENIPRQSENNSNHPVEAAIESQEAVEHNDTPLPVATSPVSEEEKERKRAKRRAHYAANREKILAQVRAWDTANREKRNEYAATYRRKASTKARVRPYLKEWEARHKSWRREYNRKYYIAHRDEMIASAMEYKRRKRESN